MEYAAFAGVGFRCVCPVTLYISLDSSLIICYNDKLRGNTMLKLRDKEKNTLSNTFLKIAEYIMALVVLGQIISNKFSLATFITGLSIFSLLVLIALFISSLTKEE